jgi:hypothetical protein
MLFVGSRPPDDCFSRVGEDENAYTTETVVVHTKCKAYKMPTEAYMEHVLDNVHSMDENNLRRIQRNIKFFKNDATSFRNLRAVIFEDPEDVPHKSLKEVHIAVTAQLNILLEDALSDTSKLLCAQYNSDWLYCMCEHQTISAVKDYLKCVKKKMQKQDC